VAAAVRRSLGRRAGPIVLRAIRHDRALQLTIAGCLVGIVALAVAAGMGMPTARGLIIFALIWDAVATVLSHRLRRLGVHRSGRNH
jgi:tryptophan-rich sensory protein